MNNRLQVITALGMALGVCAAPIAEAAMKTSEAEATLSSDQMELITQGNKAVFTGHVVLDRPPYQLKAKKMTRAEATGQVTADGRVIGTWKNPAGGKLESIGDHATYDPKTGVAELWTQPPKQVSVKWKDDRGSGDFLSDRAVLTVTPKTVQLLDHVTGHIVPAVKP